MSVKFNPFDTEAIRQGLSGFLARQGLSDIAVGPMHRFTVGFSWNTFGFKAGWVEDGKRHDKRLILRAGPPNGIFAPYKASTEFTTLKSLAGSGVPVPGVYWHSDSIEDIGAPFFVCDCVSGDAPVPWTSDGGPAFDDAERENIGGQFLSALAALHTFEWQKSPVARIGFKADAETAALDRLSEWQANLAKWSDIRVPMLEWGAIWLRQNARPAGRVSIVHGDYRIGNFLAENGRITAILDWELVGLGDPAEDLGWICLQAWRGRSPYMCHFFTREELRDRYAALTGIEVSLEAIRYWEVFGTYKLAVMHYGATHCFEKRGFNDLRMAGMAAQTPRMLLQLETAMERAA
jgi:aminoglycoside phosphotransferase (APT) family kinase protein